MSHVSLQQNDHGYAPERHKHKCCSHDEHRHRNFVCALRKSCEHEEPKLEEKNVPSLAVCLKLQDGFLLSKGMLDGSPPRRGCDFKCSNELLVAMVLVPQHEGGADQKAGENVPYQASVKICRGSRAKNVKT